MPGNTYESTHEVARVTLAAGVGWVVMADGTTAVQMPADQVARWYGKRVRITMVDVTDEVSNGSR